MHAAYPAAGAVGAAAVAVLAGGLPRALLAALAFPALVVLAAWSFPASVALVTRVLLTKAIHLSRLLEEEEGWQEEGFSDAGGARRTSEELERGLGWEGVRGRAAVQQWEWNHRRQQRQKKRREERRWQDRRGEEWEWEADGEEWEGESQEEEERQQQERRGGRRERRVDVEWEGGQLFLVVRRVVASEFLVNLVNR